MTERQKILIVDDEKANLRILSDILKTEAKLILAKDSQQAITKANKFKPDLILLDIIMPDKNGFDTIKELKKDSVTSAIPVIFISALSDVENEEKGLKLGACDYISKPFNMAIVKARVNLQLQLSRQRVMLEKLANIDPLTAIANRRKYQEVFDQEWRLATRNNRPLSLVILDIDYFKQFNDYYGHAAGDSALKQVAQALNNVLSRPGDFISRYGGEEFVIILPDTNYEGTLNIMQTCLQSVKELQIEHLKSVHQYLTISAGGCYCFPTLENSQDIVFKTADDMLYQAKQQGRDTISCLAIQ